MKSTQAILALTLFMLFSAVGLEGQTVTYADTLRGCLRAKNVKFLNELATEAEVLMASYYQGSRSNQYMEYLEDVSTLSLPRAMMQSDELALLAQKWVESKFSKDFKIKLSKTEGGKDMLWEIPPTEGQTQMTIADPLVINGKSAYAKCIESKISHAASKELLVTLHEGIDISPSLTSKVILSNTSVKDFDEETLRLAIITHVFLEIGEMMLSISQNRN